MLMRKSNIKDTIMRAVESAEKKRDEHWQTEFEDEIRKINYERDIERAELNAEIEILTREIDKLRKRIKESDKKYYDGKVLMQNAKSIIDNVIFQFRDIFDKDTGYLQSFLAIKKMAEETEKKYLLEE